MCKYCEQNINAYYDGDSIIYKGDTFGLNEAITCVYINGENGKPKLSVDICVKDSFQSLINHSVEIKYCPICGKNLVDEGDQNAS